MRDESMPQFHVVTADDGNIEAYASISRENKRAYCERHGYVFAHYHLPEWVIGEEKNLSPYWQLILPINLELAKMQEGDWLFFSGADAVINHPEYSLPALLTPWEEDDKHLYITHDKNGLNNNGFFLRKCDWSTEFMDRVWALRGETFEIAGPDGKMHTWHEQGAFINVLQISRMAAGVKQIPQHYTNGYDPRVYGNDYTIPRFMTHYPGKRTDERVYFIKRILRMVPEVKLPEGYWIDDNDHVRDAAYLDHGHIQNFRQ
jgi:hypothetical protein